MTAGSYCRKGGLAVIRAHRGVTHRGDLPERHHDRQMVLVDLDLIACHHSDRADQGTPVRDEEADRFAGGLELAEPRLEAARPAHLLVTGRRVRLQSPGGAVEGEDHLILGSVQGQVVGPGMDDVTGEGLGSELGPDPLPAVHPLQCEVGHPLTASAQQLGEALVLRGFRDHLPAGISKHYSPARGQDSLVVPCLFALSTFTSAPWLFSRLLGIRSQSWIRFHTSMMLCGMLRRGGSGRTSTSKLHTSLPRQWKQSRLLSVVCLDSRARARSSQMVLARRWWPTEPSDTFPPVSGKERNGHSRTFRDERGINTVELMSNTALAVAGLVVIWGTLSALGIDVLGWLRNIFG